MTKLYLTKAEITSLVLQFARANWPSQQSHTWTELMEEWKAVFFLCAISLTNGCHDLGPAQAHWTQAAGLAARPNRSAISRISLGYLY